MRATGWVLLCACALVRRISADPAPCDCVEDLLDCSSRDKNSLPPSEICSGATKVNLYYNNLKEFPHGLQAGFVDVDVSFNRLTALPLASMLDPRMTDLRLAGNEIGNTAGELNALFDLRTLDVSNNRISELQFLPSQCVLRELDVSENQIVSVNGPLKNCVQLESLMLTDNKLRNLPEGVFIGLSQLRELDLRENHLSEVITDMFQGLKRLEYLDLRSNNLAILHDGAFRGLNNLKILHLSANPLRLISSNAFDGLIALEHLHVSDTSLTTLHVNTFKNMTQLKTLYLNGNKLTSLPNGLFKSLKNLEEMQLQGNRLRDLPRGIFSGAERLKELLLEENLLSDLPRGVFLPLSRLVTLDLDGNRLRDLRAGTFTGLHALKKLSLRYNRLATLPLLDACCEQLTLASLRHNNLTALDEPRVRAMLRRGSDVDVRNNALRPGGLRWIAEAPDARTSVDEGACACGRVLLGGGAAVYLCVDAACGEGAATRNWVDAVRTQPARAP